MSTPGACCGNTASYTGTSGVTPGDRSDCGWSGVTIRVGRDDVYDSGGGLKKTVTIVTDRHGEFGRECRERLFKGGSLPLGERNSVF